MKPRSAFLHELDDRYAVQRRVGYPWLRFFPDLEEEYRAGFARLNILRVRVAHAVGIAAVLGFIVLDAVFGSNLEPLAADLLLVLLTIPALTVPIIASFHRAASAHLRKFIFGASLVMGLSIVGVIELGRVANPWFPYESLVLVTMYIYFVSGLLYYQAMVCGLVVWGAFLATNWTLQAHWILLYEGYYLFLANVIGWLGLYLLEWQSRHGFLLQNEMRQLAVMDSLTGLMNRRAFHTHLDKMWYQAQREKTGVGLLMLDLDDFKQMNDTHGHDYGDQALVQVGRLLRTFAQRPLDAVCRYGGDEIVVAWFASDQRGLERVCHTLTDRLAQLKTLDGTKTLGVRASGGLVLAFPEKGVYPNDAMRKADQLLYERKRGERGTIGCAMLREPGEGDGEDFVPAPS